MTNNAISESIASLLYPFVLVFGFYLLINGHITPGGGFQGGAILASIFVIRYLEHPENDLKWESLIKIEKTSLLIILLLATFVIIGMSVTQPIFRKVYLTLLNTLIGIKVGCGLSVLFIRFLFYESKG